MPEQSQVMLVKRSSITLGECVARFTPEQALLYKQLWADAHNVEKLVQSCESDEPGIRYFKDLCSEAITHDVMRSVAILMSEVESHVDA